MNDPLRAFIRERAAGRCEYCQLPDDLPPLEPFHIEHIIARQHGGQSGPHNLAWACHRCNRYKGPNLAAVDPLTSEVVLVFNPRQAHWNLHFTLNGNQITGTTATGRATVDLLQMNAPRRLERRAELLKCNRH